MNVVFRERKPLAEVFDPRSNSLNFIRLLLAVGVIIWHSFAIDGVDDSGWPLRQLVSGEGCVDGFFAVSGFLIVRSWMHDPHPGRYLFSRTSRIFPAFWVCLLITAFVIAPIFAGAWGADNVSYVYSNMALKMSKYDISGTPVDVPYPGVWNGSLWTLFWEFVCYLAVLGLGVVGILRRRHAIISLFVAAVAGRCTSVFGPFDNWWFDNLSRFAVVFLAGAVVWRYMRYIPANWYMVGACSAISLTASIFFTEYRIVAALPFAYAIICTGALIKNRRLRLTNDLSYGMYVYAFPVQQVIAITAGREINIVLFALLSIILTAPFAAMSWYLIENPIMRWKSTVVRKYMPR